MCRDRERDLDLVRAQKGPGVRAQVLYPDRNQSQDPDQEYDRRRDLSRTTEVIRETVIVKDITLRQSQFLNPDPEVNRNLDLDQGQDREANPGANDLAALKIKCQHCHGMLYNLRPI